MGRFRREEECHEMDCGRRHPCGSRFSIDVQQIARLAEPWHDVDSIS
jgi:hypothetical protein